MKLSPGSRLASSVCETEVVVVKAPDEDVSIECGGRPMSAAGPERATGDMDPAFSSGTVIGKRYTDPDGGIELLATKAGAGTLALNGVALALKEAKPLPSSD